MIQCLISLENPDISISKRAKVELITTVSGLMPQGKPDYVELRNYTPISSLARESGRKTILKAIYLIILDFCNSLNLKGNMDDVQITEAAAMLLDKCGNYRLEDYVMMFTMAKRGEFGRIYKVDILTISEIEEKYDKYSGEEITSITEKEYEEHENRIKDKRNNGTGNVLVEALKTNMLKWQKEKNDEDLITKEFMATRAERIKQIEKELQERKNS